MAAYFKELEHLDDPRYLFMLQPNVGVLAVAQVRYCYLACFVKRQPDLILHNMQR